METDQVQFTDEEDKIFAAVAKKWESTTKKLKKNGFTLLHCAAMLGKIEIVKNLVSKGVDVNAKDYKGGTPLLAAADVETAKILISSGADVNAKTDNGVTPLHVAALEVRNKKIKLVQFLVSVGADVNAKDNDGETPLGWAAINDNSEVAKFLVRNGANLDADGYWFLPSTRDDEIEKFQKSISGRRQ